MKDGFIVTTAIFKINIVLINVFKFIAIINVILFTAKLRPQTRACLSANSKKLVFFKTSFHGTSLLKFVQLPFGRVVVDLLLQPGRRFIFLQVHGSRAAVYAAGHFRC
ncbi:hypothetical protein M2298_003584 [Brevibacillus sp. 1238]|nr:hypothetical protein [Brevibacillus sp. 1238]